MERAENLSTAPSTSSIASPSINILPFILAHSPGEHLCIFLSSNSRVSIRTGLGKHPVYMAIKFLWLKPYKCHITQKGSHLNSMQSSITGLYSARYSPLHTINSCSDLTWLEKFTLEKQTSQLSLVLHSAQVVYECGYCLGQ